MAFALAILFGMGMGLSSVQAGPHLSDLSIDVNLNDSGSHDCGGCDDNRADPECGVCLSACGAGCLAFVFPIATAASLITARSLMNFETSGFRQVLAKPELFPPKTLILA